MFEDGARLIERHPREPAHEFYDLSTILEILEEGGDRDARTPEHPGATHTLGILLHRRTRRPIDHRLPDPLPRGVGAHALATIPQSSNALNTATAFWPPKPKPFAIAVRTRSSRATFGT